VQNFIGKPEGKSTLERPRRKWEDNNKIDLKEIGREGADLNHLVQDRDLWRAVVETVMNLWVPQKAGNLLTS
jgi:hypothetical protein